VIIGSATSGIVDVVLVGVLVVIIVAGIGWLTRPFLLPSKPDAMTRLIRTLRARREAATLTGPDIVFLDDPWYSISTTPESGRQDHRPTNWISRLDVGIPWIENVEATVTVRNVTAGVRRKDTDAECVVPDFNVPALRAGASVKVPELVTPHEFYDGLTDQTYENAIEVWARFTDSDGLDWEIVSTRSRE